MTTGEKITECRKKQNLTQSQLAEMLGVTRQAVSRWESDAAFPETDKLLKMSEIFDCSVDWLLKYNVDQGEETKPQKNLLDYLINFSFEYKSKRTVGKLPLVHINIGRGRTAKGFFAVGLKSVGIFSVGLLSMGIVSLGLLSLGILSFACLGLGGISLGAIVAGIFSAGGVALGVIAVGGVAVGLLAIGGCAAGGFSIGGVAYGTYIAIGDHAYGGIALGGHVAQGGIYAAKTADFKEKSTEIYAQFEALPKVFSPLTNICRKVFDGILSGAIKLGNINI